MAVYERSITEIKDSIEEDESCDLELVPGDFVQVIGRSAGQHRKVSAALHQNVWHVNEFIDVTDKTDLRKVHEMINIEREKEKKRKMSAPFGASIDISDDEFYHRSRRLSNVHEDLFKLFAIHSAVTQRRYEQQRLVAETNKQLLLEDLQRRSARKAVKEAVETERQRRISILEEMAEGKNGHTYEIADTNARLSNVHSELKDAFQYVWEKEAWNEEKRMENARETKQGVVKVVAGIKLSSELEELERKKEEEEKKLKITDGYRQIVQAHLKDVQKELVSVFDDFKKRVNTTLHIDGKNLKENEMNGKEYCSIVEEKNKGHDNETDFDLTKGVMSEINLSKVKRMENRERERRLSKEYSREKIEHKQSIMVKLVNMHKEVINKGGQVN